MADEHVVKVCSNDLTCTRPPALIHEFSNAVLSHVSVCYKITQCYCTLFSSIAMTCSHTCVLRPGRVRRAAHAAADGSRRRIRRRLEPLRAAGRGPRGSGQPLGAHPRSGPLVLKVYPKPCRVYSKPCRCRAWQHCWRGACPWRRGPACTQRLHQRRHRLAAWRQRLACTQRMHQRCIRPGRFCWEGRELQRGCACRRRCGLQQPCP